MATAYLSNENNWTVFSFEEYRIRFATSRHLEKYTQIKSWNNGYIVVMAKYDNAKDAEEDYIDLIPILEKFIYFKRRIFEKHKRGKNSK